MRPPGADDERLDRAYADSAKLRDRVDLYRWQQPRFDLHTVVPAYATFRPGDRVLDVGCGPGEALLRLAAGPHALMLVGVDRSTGMIGEASGRPGAERVRWAVGDVIRLPMPTGSVDVVLAMHMLYHASDPGVAVSELRRVLRPGGTAVVSTLGSRHLDGLRELVDDALAGTNLRWGRNRFRFDAGLLDDAFAEVECHELQGEVVLDTAEPVASYVASTADFYDAPGGWDAVVADVDRAVRAHLTRDGAFRILTAVDVYVCR